MRKEVYAVRRRFTAYDELPGDTGLVFALRGHRLDEKLVRLGYVEKVEGNHALATCGICGLSFLTERHRDAHGDLRHNPHRDLDAIIAAGMVSALEGMPAYSATGIHGAMVEDLSGDAEERHLEQEAPLYLEKTRASQR